MRGLKKAVVGLIVMMSGLCSAEIEERLQVKNESTFLDNLSFSFILLPFIANYSIFLTFGIKPPIHLSNLQVHLAHNYS